MKELSDDGSSSAHVPRAVSGNEPRESSLPEMIAALKPHDHLCLIYESPEEWRAAVVPFLSLGLQRGEKCVYVVDTHTADEIRGCLKDAGVDVAAVEKSGQFIILSEAQAYLREGVFDPDRMIALLIEETRKAVAAGYPALRVTGEMTWVLRGHPGSERLLEYEAKLNRDLFPEYPCLAICQYDRWKFDPEIIKGVVMTHPLLIKGNRVYRNFYFVPADEFLTSKKGERELQHWLNNIVREQRNEELLKESEEKYRTLVERANDGIIIVQDGIVVFANARMGELDGTSPEQIVGTPHTDHVHPDCLKDLVENYNRRMAGESLPSIYETVLKRHDGSALPAELNACVISYHGRPADMVIVRDITERKRAEEYLQKFKHIVSSTADGISLLDRNYRYVIVNKAYEASSGKTQEELVGVTVAEYLGEAVFREQIKPQFDECLKGKSIRYRDWFEYPALGRRFVEVTYLPYVDAKGDVSGIVANTRDITERKKAEQALADEVVRRRILVEQSRDGIVVLDRDGKVYEANQRYAEMLGYTTEEVRNLYIWDWNNQYPREQLLGMLNSVDEEGDHFETRHRRKDGSLFDVEISTNGAEIGGRKLVFCVCRDITERKKAEAKMEKQLAELRQWYSATLDREERILELKREVDDVLKRAGERPRYGVG